MKNLIYEFPVECLGYGYERNGEAVRFPGGLEWRSNLELNISINAIGSRKGILVVGSTNVGSLAFETTLRGPLTRLISLQNEASRSALVPPQLRNRHQLQTPSGFAGRHSCRDASLVSGELQKYQSVATISYTGSESVTEWGSSRTAALASRDGVERCHRLAVHRKRV